MSSAYRLTLLMGIVIVSIAGATVTASAEKLQVSENGRYLLRADDTPFFALADTAWGLPWKLTRGEIDDYFRHRKNQQFNMIAMVAFPSYEGGKILPNAQGDFPFALESDMWDAARPLETPGANPDEESEYDYWDHLEYAIDTADAQGLQVILLPAWGCYVAGSYVKGDPSPEIIFDPESAYAYGHWIGQRFSEKQNIVWMIGGDRSAVYGERDYRAAFRAMAEGVADGVNGISQMDGEADYSTTIMSYHPRKWHPNSSQWFHEDPWLDFNSIQDQPSDQINAVAHDYALAPAKPTWLFEGGYENRARGEAVYGGWQMRFQAYQTVFAGGFGVTYGSMDVFHFGAGVTHLDEPVTGAKAQGWKAELDQPGAQQMTYLFELMSSLSEEQFLDRIPDQGLLGGDTGGMIGPEGILSTSIVPTRGEQGDYAMVYTANGRDIRVNMDRLQPDSMNAYWFNPRSGKWWVSEVESDQARPFQEGISTGAGAPAAVFDPPGETADGNDWVLVLKAD